ncbi:hypothetical protein ACIPPS_06865 [Streptomyces sp. NPDC090127]
MNTRMAMHTERDVAVIGNDLEAAEAAGLGRSSFYALAQVATGDPVG